MSQILERNGLQSRLSKIASQQEDLNLYHWRTLRRTVPKARAQVQTKHSHGQINLILITLSLICVQILILLLHKNKLLRTVSKCFGRRNKRAICTYSKRENRAMLYYVFISYLDSQTCNITAYKHAISFNYITLFFSFYLKFTKNIFSNCMVIYSVIYTRNICSQSIQVIIIRHLNSPLLNPCKQTGNLLWYYTTHLHVHKR